MFIEFYRYAKAILLSASLSLLLFGCGGGGGSATPAPTATPAPAPTPTPTDGSGGGFTVTGTIVRTDNNNLPLSGATVTLYNTSYTIYTVDGSLYSTVDPATNTSSVTLGSVALAATTDAYGNYALNGVRSGRYKIKPTYTGLLIQKRVGRGYLYDSGVVTITDNGTVYIYNPDPGNGNFPTVKTSGTINNVVIDILYNIDSITLTSDHLLTGQDFEASLPGSSGL